VKQPIKLEGEKELLRALNNVGKVAKDLRPLWITLFLDFYKTEENMVFRSGQNVGGPGKYRDLKESTKRQKRRRYGSEYPVLVASGRLKRSLSKPGGENIARSTKTEGEIGTRVPYGILLQEGTRNMPSRPPIIMGLLIKRWQRTIDTYGRKFDKSFKGK